MFGWEFPPHISGGLGTACYGLTKGMKKIDDLEIIFVVPKTFGGEDQNVVNIIGADNYAKGEFLKEYEDVWNEIEVIEVSSNMVPYTDPGDFYQLVEKKENRYKKFIHTNVGREIVINGGYGPGLWQEIYDYAHIASIIGKEHDFDIIHAHDWLTFQAGIAVKEVTGKPLVIHVHATDFDRSGGNVNPGVFEIEKKGMEAADKIIAVSNLTKNTIIHNYGIHPEKVVTIHNAVEPRLSKERLKQQRGVRDKIITFLGRFTVQKGPGYFVEAAYKVLQKKKDVRFVMAGSGEMFEELIHRVAALGISDRFYFTGFLRGDDVHEMFAMSDVYVMPSISEPFGISPLEALQYDVPVIISHQSGVSEILQNAIKVYFWDVDAMADAMYGIVQYNALSELFRQGGKKEVNSIKWETPAKKVKQLYDTIC